MIGVAAFFRRSLFHVAYRPDWPQSFIVYWHSWYGCYAALVSFGFHSQGTEGLTTSLLIVFYLFLFNISMGLACMGCDF